MTDKGTGGYKNLHVFSFSSSVVLGFQAHSWFVLGDNINWCQMTKINGPMCEVSVSIIGE